MGSSTSFERGPLPRFNSSGRIRVLLGPLLSAYSRDGCSARGCLELQLQLRGGIELNAAGRQCWRGEGSSLDPARVAAICDLWFL